MTDDIYKEIREQADLIRHFKNLFGYTRESVSQAINEISQDCLPDDDGNTTELQDMLSKRASQLAESLEYIEERIG